MPFIDEEALRTLRRPRSQPRLIRPPWKEDLQLLYNGWRELGREKITDRAVLWADADRNFEMPVTFNSPFLVAQHRNEGRSRVRTLLVRRVGACEPCRLNKLKCDHVDLTVFEQNFRLALRAKLFNDPNSGYATDSPGLDALEVIIAAEQGYNNMLSPHALSGDSLSTQMSRALGRGSTWRNGASRNRNWASRTRNPNNNQAQLPSVADILRETSAPDPLIIYPNGRPRRRSTEAGPSRSIWCDACGVTVDGFCSQCDSARWIVSEIESIDRRRRRG